MCYECGYGKPIEIKNTRSLEKGEKPQLCENCGYYPKRQNAIGRYVSTSVWWNPWTWNNKHIEWHPEAKKAKMDYDHKQYLKRLETPEKLLH